jgi:hypothetical protein
VINKHGIFWKFEGASRLSKIVDPDLEKQQKAWKPTDCLLLKKNIQNKLQPFSILIAGATGLYEY